MRLGSQSILVLLSCCSVMCVPACGDSSHAQNVGNPATTGDSAEEVSSTDEPGRSDWEGLEPSVSAHEEPSHGLGSTLNSALTTIPSSLTYFGYTGADLSKTGSYSNMVTLDARASLPGGLSDAYVARQSWLQYQARTVLNFTNFIYSGGGASYKPIDQVTAAFDAWLARETPYFSPTYVLAIYPADEPLWRCANPGQNGFATVYECMVPYFRFVSHIQSRLIEKKMDVPLVTLIGSCDFSPSDPICPSFAAPKPLLNTTCLDSTGKRTVCPSDFLQAGIDWVATGTYGIKRPYDGSDSRAVLLRTDINKIKAMFPNNPWLLIGDAFHSECYHAGWTAADHVLVADQDYRLACNKGAIGLINFHWPSWSECGTSHGSNEFGPGGIFGNSDALCYQRCIGRRIKYNETTCKECGIGMYVNCP